MQREVMWTPWVEPGLEHLRLTGKEGSVDADSLLIGLEAGRAFRAAYTLRCDSAWRTREVRVAILDGGQPTLHLVADGAGHWTTREGVPLPFLNGCIDLDLSATPFTNTLPIRRLGWTRGASAELVVAYVALPALNLTAEHQRYTCLDEPSAAQARFRFEAPASGFVADLTVDADGVVLDYPGLFRRVWSASRQTRA